MVLVVVVVGVGGAVTVLFLRRPAVAAGTPAVGQVGDTATGDPLSRTSTDPQVTITAAVTGRITTEVCWPCRPTRC